MKLIRTKTALVIFSAVFQIMMARSYTANASNDLQHVMDFKIPLVAGVEKYSFLLEYPSFIAMAVDNCGIEFRIVGNINVVNSKKFSWSGVSIEFIKKDGQLFIYDAKLITSFGKVLPEVRFTLDTTNVSKGLIVVNVYSKYTGLLPKEFAFRFEPKLLNLFNIENQERVLRYLRELSDDDKQNDGKLDIGKLILIDGYNGRSINRSATPYSEIQNDKFGKVTLLLYIITVALITIPFCVLKKAKKKEAV